MDDVKSVEVYVVPNFISEGYFTRTVLPREMQLDGPVTTRERQLIKYCRPVGSHSRMTDILVQKAEALAPDIPPQETSLFIVGHGTPLDSNSATAAKEQADKIRRLERYGEVFPAYLEEEPRIAGWHLSSRHPNVIVIPLFIADGLHGDQDIPELLGLPAGASGGPFLVHGRRLFYGGAVGTDPMMTEIILDQVRAFDPT